MLQRAKFQFSNFLNKVIAKKDSGEKPAVNPPAHPQTTSPKLQPYIALTEKKQQELNILCEQLFKKKELIASGKLQFLGLDKIIERMGDRWNRLQDTVYKTVEDVISTHMGPGDFFLRYKGNSYVIIFAHASRQEAQTKANMMVREIKQCLFSLNESDLNGIEVKATVSEISARDFASQKFPAVLDHAFSGSTPPQSAVNHGQTVYTAAVTYTYIPLWDVARGAMTTYFCMPNYTGTDTPDFKAYQSMYKSRSTEARLGMDLSVLKVVIDELAEMEKEGKKFFLVCPVHNETLSRIENFESYKQLCQKIPAEQRKVLIFMIIDMPDGVSLQEPYRFVTSLKSFCTYVFARNVLSSKLNYRLLKASGIDGIGLIASDTSKSEAEIIPILNQFGAEAKTNKIERIFVLDVPSLSLTTSAICAGFNYLGGPEIHENVARPDHIYRYKHEDLISQLIEGK